MATNASLSNDVQETIAEDYFACAKTYERRFVNAEEANFEMLISVVWFIADSLVHREVARDVRWFDASLDAIIELLVPTRRVTARGTQLRKQARDVLCKQST